MDNHLHRADHGRACRLILGEYNPLQGFQAKAPSYNSSQVRLWPPSYELFPPPIVDVLRLCTQHVCRRLPGLFPLLALLTCLSFCPYTLAAGRENTRLVVVLYPNSNDGRPGSLLVDQSIRSTFATGSLEHIEVHNEYLDISHFSDVAHQQLLADFLQRKYAGRKVDLVIVGLSSALDFALKYRATIFPGVPIVFCAVDQREVAARRLPPDVVGVPIRMDLAGTLDLALRLHPNTRRVFVVAGASRFDARWEAEARRTFQGFEDRLEFVYLTGLPMEDLLREVSHLPEGSLVYYLHVFQDGAGKVHLPVDVLERLAAVANAPIYGHVDTYVGRGIVGGRVFSFETEGKNAAQLGLRILAGEQAKTIAIPQPSENAFLLDWRQLQRWGISEDRLPAGSVVLHKVPSFWDLYRWNIIGVISLCVIETLMIVGLLVQTANLRRAEAGLRESQRELRLLTGRLLQAQEMERRRIARELHDDLNQSLALLAVEMDLLSHKPPDSTTQLSGRIQELSARVKELSSSVHELSHRLHPSKLEQLGLAAAVRSLCQELTQAHGLQIKFTFYQVPEGLPEDTALCLYRIAQEGLRNVIKHSGAQQAAVKLGGSTDTLSLSIVDDGVGFDPGLVDGQGGLGLISMRERLRLVDGTIAIDSRRSSGTRIEVRVPLGTTSRSEGILSAQIARV